MDMVFVASGQGDIMFEGAELFSLFHENNVLIVSFIISRLLGMGNSFAYLEYSF